MTEEHLRAQVVRQLQLAVRTMRSACDRAERDLESGDGGACQRVMHAMAWGLANASGSIETAMSYVEDAHEVALHNAKNAT